MLRRILFSFGMAAVLVYAVTVILGGILRPGYNHLSMAVSELIAAGAPNKTLLDALFIAYNLFLIVFAWVVGMSVRSDGRPLAVAGAVILAAVGLLGLVMTLFFPMDPRGSPTTSAGTVHLVLASLLSLGSILSIVFLTFGGKERDAFWFYSMASFILVFLSGAFAAVSAAQGSPFLGLAERITIGLFLQWVAGLSGRLAKEDLGR